MARIRNKKNSSKKDTIIEKASKLFREKGFGAASMRDLAENVGVEAASLERVTEPIQGWRQLDQCYSPPA